MSGSISESIAKILIPDIFPLSITNPLSSLLLMCSLIATPEVQLPSAILGSHFSAKFLLSSLFKQIGVIMELPTQIAGAANFPICSAINDASRIPKPDPPNFSGTNNPLRPISKNSLLILLLKVFSPNACDLNSSTLHDKDNILDTLSTNNSCSSESANSIIFFLLVLVLVL